MTIKELKYAIKDIDDDMPVRVQGSKSEPLVIPLLSEDGATCHIVTKNNIKVSLHGGDMYEG